MQTGDCPLSATRGRTRIPSLSSPRPFRYVILAIPSLCHPRVGGDLLTDCPKAAIEIAKGLLKDGVPMEIIVRNTGLSEEQIRKL